MHYRHAETIMNRIQDTIRQISYCFSVTATDVSAVAYGSNYSREKQPEELFNI
jgi:hypothetical protein